MGSPANAFPTFLTVDECADALKMRPSWVYEQCRMFTRTRGREGIPCKRFGRAVRIMESDLQGWLDRR
jgi:hypothetical protein